VREQPIDLVTCEHDRQQAVLAAVVVEDVGERRSYDRAKAVVEERPGRVLARAAAAEIAPREQDRSTLIARIVEDEVGVARPPRIVHGRLAAIEVTPCVEQIRTKA